jgi:imidazolonepropionase-like amidohydrolase
MDSGKAAAEWMLNPREDRMFRNFLLPLIAAGALASGGMAQETDPLQAPATPLPAATFIHCGAVLDANSEHLRLNVVIAIKGDKIESVQDYSVDWKLHRPEGSVLVDLDGETCMPGLIDTHTHVLLQEDVTREEYDEQLLKWSLPYRTIRGTVAARKALEYGFTTIRDLETEGALYADVSIRDAIKQGWIPGPRMQVATRALDVTGAYPLLGFAPEVPVPHGVQFVDGPVEARKAVREQISFGADWIKVYADRSYKLAPGGVLDDIPTFTPEDLRAIVDEAHREGHKVAAHATALHGAHNAVEAGVDTIEHGDYIAEEDLKTMAERGIYYVPTLYIGEYVAQGRAAEGAPVWVDMIKIHAETFRRALQAGVKVAFGTDVGGFTWQITPAREFPLMVKYGMTPAQAIRAATVTAADLMGIQDSVGSLEPGKFADVIAVKGNPLDDLSLLEHVSFVMKGGKAYKRPD